MAAKDDIQDILQYYSKNGEDNRHKRHQLEFAIMARALKAYLGNQVSLNVLELGAGSGLYTEFLAQLGHQVTAVEPTESLHKMNQTRIQNAGLSSRVSHLHSDARDILKSLPEESKTEGFDVILNMGPLYHLTQESDRVQLVIDSRSILKPQGLHFSVVLSRAGFTSYLLNYQPENLIQDPEGFREIQTEGYFLNHPRDGVFRGYYTNLADLSTLHEKTQMTIQKLHVLDPCIGSEDKIFNQIDPKLKEVWADVLFALSSDPDYWGTGRTWLAIAQVRV